MTPQAKLEKIVSVYTMMKEEDRPPLYDQEFRLYSFVNGLYMKEIQWGLQTAHATAELFNSVEENRYLFGNTDACYRAVRNWSEHHKTIIILDGGPVGELLNKFALLQKVYLQTDFHIPFAYFNEDSYSLNEAITSVVCVVPEQYYNAISLDKLKAMSAVNVTHLTTGKKLEADFQEWDEGTYFWVKDGEIKRWFAPGSPDAEFIAMLKSCNLAR